MFIPNAFFCVWTAEASEHRPRWCFPPLLSCPGVWALLKCAYRCLHCWLLAFAEWSFSGCCCRTKPSGQDCCSWRSSRAYPLSCLTHPALGLAGKASKNWALSKSRFSPRAWNCWVSSGRRSQRVGRQASAGRGWGLVLLVWSLLRVTPLWGAGTVSSAQSRYGPRVH